MPDAIRADIVSLLVDVHVRLEQPPENWIHWDGRPVTADEADLISEAAPADWAAARDYHKLVLEYDKERLAGLLASRRGWAGLYSRLGQRLRRRIRR